MITQSTSRTGSEESGRREDDQEAEVRREREASSFLSKQGIIAKCQMREGGMARRCERTVFRSVPVRACGDLSRERCGRMWGWVFSA